VRILVEGFDAPITKGVCFLHLPSSKTTLIQIIGRALRPHPLKNIANIILPFSSKEDEKSISNFLQVMAQNDSRIRKSYESKKLGGYISVERATEKSEEDEENEVSDDIDFRYEFIYDSVGALKNGVEIWMKKLEEVKKYIDENGKRPPCKDKNIDVKRIGGWLSHQQTNYSKKEKIMKNEKIYNEWTKFIQQYKDYFINNEEQWYSTFNELKKYIDKNKKRPSNSDKNNEIKKLAGWICDQQKNYAKKDRIMKKNEIYDIWTNFIDKYKQYFMNFEETWINTLDELKKYIDINKKRPSPVDKNINIKRLGLWMSGQQRHYTKKEYMMERENIRKLWEQFIEDYSEYIKTGEEKWKDTLETVKKYIDTNKKRPSNKSNDIKIQQLGTWLSFQKQNYIKKEQIMKNEEIQKLWKEFIESYEQYFKSNDEEWIDTLNNVKQYISKNNKLPSTVDKNVKVKQMGTWLNRQHSVYKNKVKIMNDDKIHKLWDYFLKEHKEILEKKSNDEIWYDKLNDVKKYIEKNKKHPIYSDNDKASDKLAHWVRDQTRNYKDHKKIMKNAKIRKSWEDFTEEYADYFKRK
jgi:hypothetical protein